MEETLVMLVTLKDGPCAGRVVGISHNPGGDGYFTVPVDLWEGITSGMSDFGMEPSDFVKTATYNTKGWFVSKNY